jgi:septation ring formation regulator EzrA
LSGRLRKQFLELLEKDKEFRYTVAGYLGLSEILQRFDEHDKKFEKILEEIRSLEEYQNKILEELKSLREGQDKVGQEIERLNENYARLDNKLTKLENRATGLEKAMATLAKAVGVTLNDFVASFVEEMLRVSGVPEEKIKVSASVKLLYGETLREIDIFNSDPLVVGQVTTYISTIEEARKELEKLLEDVEFVEKITGRKVFMAILAVENTPPEVSRFLEDECERHKVKYIQGRFIPKLPVN